MPTLRLLLNLGEPDAKRLGLDPTDAKAGNTIDVDDATAEAMLKRGWAAVVNKDGGTSGIRRHDDAAKAGFAGDNIDTTETGRADILATPAGSAKLVKAGETKAGADGDGDGGKDAVAVADADDDGASTSVSTASAPDFDAMTKPDLLDYAKANGVPGTPPSASKEQLLEAIKKHAGKNK